MVHVDQMTKIPSSEGLTRIDPRSLTVWLSQKSNLETLHGCALFTKVVANLLRNKSCFMIISWKWLEHAQTWPISQKYMLIATLKNMLSLNCISVASSSLGLHVTLDPWRVRCWSLKRNCIGNIGLQLWCSILPLTRHGLGVNHRQSIAIRRRL